MKLDRLKLLACALMLVSSGAGAQVTVTDPWVRATVARQRSSAAFMHLVHAQGGKLVEARTPIAGIVEIHESYLDNDIARMRPVAAVELPPGKPVELRPRGFHIMLMELKQQLKDGDAVPLTLVIESRDGKRESVDVKAAVRPMQAPVKGHAH